VGRVSVERTIDGDAPVDLLPLEIDLGDDLCAQVRDVIPADALPPGSYHYVVRVLQGGAIVHENTREFRVTEPQR
jgi:hypothetical protein